MITVLNMSWAYVYFALYLFYMMQSVHKLRPLPRQEHKMSNLMVRLQARSLAYPNYSHALRNYMSPKGYHFELAMCFWHLG